MQQQELLGALVNTIYEAALDPPRWKDFLVRFAVAMNSQASMIWAHDFTDRSVDILGASGAIANFHGVDPAFMDLFAQHYSQCNVWLEDATKHVAGTVVHSSALYPDAQLSRTEWHADWLRPQNLFYSSAAIVEKRDDRSFNVTAVRSKSAGEYTPEEMQVLHTLMPHLQTAFALHRRLHRAEALAQASVAVLDGMPMGVVLLGEHAQVLHANTRAHAMAGKTRLFRLGAGQVLQAVGPADDKELQAAMRRCVGTGLSGHGAAGGALQLRGLDGMRLQLLVTPLPRPACPFGEQTAAAVFISDPDVTIQSLVGVLRNLYGMTLAEARLAQSLVNGMTLQEHADGLGLSVHTARTQFKSAAQKVGVGRQADFVRAILTGPALLRWADQESMVH